MDCNVYTTLPFIVLSLSKRCCLCSLRVFLLPSLSLSITPGLKPYLSLFTALLVLSFTPGLLTLFTALSFSSLESSWSYQLESIFTFLLIVLDFGYCSLAVSQNFFFVFFMRVLTQLLTRVECARATKGIPPSYDPSTVSRHFGAETKICSCMYNCNYYS